MELPGDIFKPYIGLVHQNFKTPIGRLMGYKMTRCTLDINPDKLDTPNNADPDFMTNIRVKRRCSGTLHNVTFDDIFNPYGLNPYGNPLTLHDGMNARLLCRYYTAVPRAGSVSFEEAGVPMWGGADLPAAVSAMDYVFICIRVMRIRHEGDAGGGQPFDLEWESNGAFRLPGEADDLLAMRGYLPLIGAGGFL